MFNWAVLAFLAKMGVLYVALLVWVADFAGSALGSPVGDQALWVWAMVAAVVGGGFVVVWWPVLRVVRRSRVFVSPQGDAMLVIRPRRGGWLIEDHLSARPGEGQGARLRALLGPGLLAAADELGVVVEAVAASPVLAARYVAEVPGLVVTGDPTSRGTPMRREPAGDRTG